MRPDLMTAVDPYRVLGLAPGAPLDEVKRAYRRLAKQAHPDASGGTATTRFIALQQAYEAIVKGGRHSIATRPRGTGSHPSPGARPSPGQRPGGRPSPGARPGGPRPGGARPAGAAGARSGERAGATGGPTTSARLGTTSYDGADVEMERPADWQGASWYGVSMGTYWTVNPKEYADPRKHGPEYLARGRRVRRTGIAVEVAEPEVAPASSASAPGPSPSASPSASASGPGSASTSTSAPASSSPAPSAERPRGLRGALSGLLRR